MCARGETLLVSIETSEEIAELRIERFNPSSNYTTPTSREAGAGEGDRVSQALYLADAIVSKAGGEFSFSDSPLSLSTQLPCNSTLGTATGDAVRSFPFPSES
jgi:hypothetical protein